MSGIWVGFETGGGPGKSDLEVRFKTDGTYALTQGTGQISVETDGTYAYDEATKTLTLEAQKVQVLGKESDLPEGPNKFAVTWKGRNEFVLKTKKGEIDLKRQ